MVAHSSRISETSSGCELKFASGVAIILHVMMETFITSLASAGDLGAVLSYVHAQNAKHTEIRHIWLCLIKSFRLLSKERNRNYA
jgi:hypothetical protein